MLRKMLLGILVPLSAVFVAGAHAEWNDSIEYRAQIGTSLSAGDHTPLLLNANRFGFSSIERNNLWLRLGAFKHEDEQKDFSWGAGLDMGVAYRFQSVFVPQQLYAEVRYRCMDALIGAKELTDGFVPEDLSMGSLTQSNNARPIPQLRIGIFDYADVWGCKQLFAIKGHVAYGMFDDNWWIKRWASPETTYTLNTLYCSRAIYFRVGNTTKFPLEGELGLVMDSQFGGKTWVPDNNGGHWEKHPTYAKAWLKALVPMHGGDDTPGADQTNVEGNFLGNWSFSLKWQSPQGWMIRAYYQHFFEDHSMLFFDYPWKDGLYGLQAKLPENPVISEIDLEYLYTKDQSGPVYWDHTPDINYQISGRDSYYNNYMYTAWQHWGQAIGNPSLVSPIYNANHMLTFRHNRVSSFHLGFKGNPSKQVSYRVLATHTRSWGTYTNPLPRVEADFSWLAEVKYQPVKLKGWEASLSLAGDHGSLLGNSFGVQIAISKTGWIKYKDS